MTERTDPSSRPVPAAEPPPRDLSLFRAMMRSIPDPVWLKDAAGRYLACNRIFERLVGATEDTIVGCTDHDLSLPERADVFRRKDLEALAAGRPTTSEQWLEFTDGGYRGLFETVKTPMYDASGELLGVLGIARDISELHAARRRAEQGERRLEMVLNAANEGIWDWDLRTHTVAHNAEWSRLLGITDGRLSRPFGEFTAMVHPDDRERVAAAVRDSFKTGQHSRREHRMVRADGRVIWVLNHGAVVERDADGRVARMAGSIADITARKETEIALRESEEHYRRISELTSDVIFSCHRGADGLFRIDWCAGNAGAVFGFGNDELLARGCWRCSVVAEDQPLFERNITGLRPGQSSDFVVRIVHADGSTHWLHSVARVEDDPAGHGEHRLHGACQDITARHAAESARRESEQRYRALFAGSGDGIFVTCDNRVVDCNESAARIFRCRREELIGRPIAALSPERQPDGSLSAEAVPRRSSRAGAQGIFEWRHLRPDGSTFDAEINLTAVGIEGETHIIGILRDITERKQAEAEIEFLAHHDALTGLPNRVLLRDRYAHARAVAERNGTSAALLFIDLDNFKTVNDSLGHAAGDELLKAVVARLTQCVRDTDTVSRQGGDEFIVLLGDMSDPAAAERVAGEILLRLAEPFTLGSHVVNSGGSIGIALHPGDGDDFDTLLQKADTAMYNAKAAGRNTCRFFAEAMNARVRDHLQLQGHLRRALAEGGFRLAYQPKYSIDGSRITGLEALLRLSVPELGELSPGRFIPVAEDCGLIVPIGRWVLEAACRQLMAWRAAGIDAPPVSVNLSALQVHRPGLVGTVAEVLAATGLPPRLLEIELTESILLHDVDNTLATVRDLKRLGLTLAIDDFGTGYSSLAYLKRFAVDKLKIDQSFVRDIVSDPDDAAIVRAVIQLARSMRLGIVAEGVETEEQLAFLRAEGCEEIQGYLFSRPLPPAAVAALLRA